MDHLEYRRERWCSLSILVEILNIAFHYINEDSFLIAGKLLKGAKFAFFNFKVYKEFNSG